MLLKVPGNADGWRTMFKLRPMFCGLCEKRLDKFGPKAGAAVFGIRWTGHYKLIVCIPVHEQKINGEIAQILL